MLVAITLALAATCAASNVLSFPISFPLERRQDISAAEYSCHENCGNIIITYRSGSEYCDNSTYKSELSACLNCAEEYDIWQYYGDSVSAAATACGDDATPSPASTSAASAAATSSSGAASNGTAAVTTSAAVTSSASTNSTVQSASQTASSASSVSTYTGAANVLAIQDSLVAVGAAAAALRFVL